MNSTDPIPAPGDSGARPLLRVLGVGGAGQHAVDLLASAAPADLECAALNCDLKALSRATTSTRLQLGAKLTRGLGTGGDPLLGRAAAEADLESIRGLCAGAELVFVLAGLGGGTGSGAAPVVARVAKECGAMALGVVTLPFLCEGTRRQQQAQRALQELKASADGVLCLPNQSVAGLLEESSSLLETFRLSNQLWIQGVLSLARLVTQPGLIPVDFADLKALLAERHTESRFAVAEARGPQRSREIVEQLLASPLLDKGRALAEAQAVLVSLAAGPDLGMGELQRIMEQISRHCEGAQVVMGAAVEPAAGDRLSATAVVAHRAPDPDASATHEPRLGVGAASGTAAVDSATAGPFTSGPQFETSFFRQVPQPRPPSRFVPPAPASTPEAQARLAAQQESGGGARKTRVRLRQGMLPLEIVSKGRFEKSEPTLHQGEDLDVPTYIRRGIPLN
jgi:cell division protein FtsZ